MTEKERIELKEKIDQEIEKLQLDISELKEQVKPIAPENAIGRLSRMDAINNRSVNEAALRKYDIELAQFRTRKAANIAQVVMDTATAIMRAYAELGPVGGTIAAAFLGVLSGTKIGLIASEPPPARPQLAAGGLIPSVQGGVPVTVGEGRYDELVMPLNDDVFRRFSEGLMEAGYGSTRAPQQSSSGDGLTIVIEGLGEIVIDKIQDRINNRKIRIPASAIVRR